MMRCPSLHHPRQLLCALLLLALAGCAGTRNLPNTNLPPVDASGVASGALLSVPFYAGSLHTDLTEIGGGHHEGIAQVRQPWIWGLSEPQREALYGRLKDIARDAFLDELQRLGIKLRLAIHRSTTPPGLELSGGIERIELNTYGRGLTGPLEGFGSAGDYWEARVNFDKLKVIDRSKNTLVWQGRITQYAKRPDSPVKLDMNHLDLLATSLRISLATSNPTSLAETVQQSRASYQIDDTGAHPVELAARLAARELVKRLRDHYPPARR